MSCEFSVVAEGERVHYVNGRGSFRACVRTVGVLYLHYTIIIANSVRPRNSSTKVDRPCAGFRNADDEFASSSDLRGRRDLPVIFVITQRVLSLVRRIYME